MFKRNQNNLLIMSLMILLVLLYVMYNFNVKREKTFLYRLEINNEQWMSNKYNYNLNFERIIAKWCDPKNLSLNYECLKRVNELDQQLDGNIKPVCSNNDKIIFHTFWQFKTDSSFHFRVLKLNVMSFLTTQNLDCSKLILWTHDSFPLSINSKILSIFKFYVKKLVLELRKFDLNELCNKARNKNAHFAKSSICINRNHQNYSEVSNLVGLSDLVRFFVLDIYGGKIIYIF